MYKMQNLQSINKSTLSGLKTEISSVEGSQEQNKRLLLSLKMEESLMMSLEEHFQIFGGTCFEAGK